uniref:hypothetical protein n=1 Tax=Actinomadura sp. CA-154981 TaxID=3240037 RepID=UPI003F498D24
MSRWLNPRLGPAFVGAVIAAVYAAAAMLVRAYKGDDVLDAAGALLYQLWTRLKVTPTADPKSAAGVPLVPRPTIRSDVEP